MTTWAVANREVARLMSTRWAVANRERLSPNFDELSVGLKRGGGRLHILTSWALANREGAVFRF